MTCIGKDMRERMELLGLTEDGLAEKAVLERDTVDAILRDEVAFEEIDPFDMALLCNALCRKPDFFTDESVKERDLVSASDRPASDDEKSRNVKARIGDFMNDFALVEEVFWDDFVYDR